MSGVSLAKVAAALHLATTALYRYVDSKATLVDVMVDAALGDPPELNAPSWQERVRAWVASLADRYREHPWLADYRPTGVPQQPRPMAWINALVETVANANVDGIRLALLLDGVVRSSSALAHGLAVDTAPEPWLARAVADRYPALNDAIQRDWSDADAELTYAVDIVLQGATARAASASA